MFTIPGTIKHSSHNLRMRILGREPTGKITLTIQARVIIVYRLHNTAEVKFNISFYKTTIKWTQVTFPIINTVQKRRQLIFFCYHVCLVLISIINPVYIQLKAPFGKNASQTLQNSTACTDKASNYKYCCMFL